MKIKAICTKCTDEDMISYEINLTDKNIYKITCIKGHTTYVSFYFQKFELLFENAVISFNENRFRESILNAAASLERFYEFVIRFLYFTNYNKPSGDEAHENLSLTWKKLKFSERQLGAYSVLFSLFFQEIPNILSDRNVNMRNSVVHNGYFPEQEEALLFLNEVFQIIKDTSIKMKSYNGPEFHKLYEHELDKNMESEHYDVSERMFILEDFIFSTSTQSIRELTPLKLDKFIGKGKFYKFYKTN